ncbi:MAG: AAA family ATPase [Anaerotignum sp.]
MLKHIKIDRFRKLQNIEFDFGKKVTAIVGQNGTMKTTILGIIAQSFSVRTDEIKEQKTIDGYTFESKFSDKFKISIEYEPVGSHLWSVTVDPTTDIKETKEFTSISRKESGKPERIRFWTSGSRQSGDGFIQYPLIYLSLQRLSPIGEQTKLDTTSHVLSAEEMTLFTEYYNKILLVTEDLADVELIKGSNSKTTLGAKNQQYGSLTISAGQDNIGKILMAVLSFKRLKDTLKDKYKGGLLLIDELDATLFPAAQEKLVEMLFKFARDFNLQIIFTTHSYNIIEVLKQYQYRFDSKLIYLKSVGDRVTLDDNVTLESIDADLKVRVASSKTANKPPKIKIYTEDEEAMIFTKRLLERQFNNSLFKFMDKISLGCKNYKELIRKSVPEFKNNLIVLDGDETATSSNIVTLPGNNQSPEQLIYSYLKSLGPEHDFWDNSPGGYSAQVCFRDYPNTPKSREEYKNWFKSQEQYWGTGCKKLFNLWKKDNPQAVEDFLEKFKVAYNKLAKQQHLQLLE